MKQIICYFTLSILISNFLNAQDSLSNAGNISRPEILDISIINLIANPEKYHNKEVIISGYLNLQFEGTAIYIHKEDFDNGLRKNGLWVNFFNEIKKEELSNAHGNYVMIRGLFDMERKGHWGLWSGTIKDIKSVTPLPKGKK